MTDIGHALRDTLLALTRIPSPIGEEAELCDHVEERLSSSLGADAITRFHDSLIVHAARRPGAPRIALVGHLDTVRTRHDGPARVEGNLLYGAGAADMKSGLAIMIELVERLDMKKLPCDLTLIFYEREEGPFEENRLGPILDTHPALHELDLAVCLEPPRKCLDDALGSGDRRLFTTVEDMLHKFLARSPQTSGCHARPSRSSSKEEAAGPHEPAT